MEEERNGIAWDEERGETAQDFTGIWSVNKPSEWKYCKVSFVLFLTDISFIVTVTKVHIYIGSGSWMVYYRMEMLRGWWLRNECVNICTWWTAHLSHRGHGGSLVSTVTYEVEAKHSRDTGFLRQKRKDKFFYVLPNSHCIFFLSVLTHRNFNSVSGNLLFT